MTTATGRPNRGPAAAAENRRAILASARILFAESGYGVPLQAIAKHAGVGQGVLYRHFPSRLDLASAVFDENLRELELIATGGEDTFERLWTRLLELMTDATAFIEMIMVTRAGLADDGGAGRLAALLETPLAGARDRGVVAADRDVADVILALRMIFGACLGLDPTQRQRAVERAQRLLAL